MPSQTGSIDLTAQVAANTNAKGYADSAVDGLEIGGRNLLLHTAELDTTAYWTRSAISSMTAGQADPDGGTSAFLITPSSSSWYLCSSSNNAILKAVGETYTFSIWLKAASATTCDICARYVRTEWSDGSGATATTRRTVDLTTSWQRFTVTGTLEYVQDRSSTSKYGFWFGQKTDVAVYAYHPKLEKGNHATDWSPATEDTSDTEYIVGTQTSKTGSWTGVTRETTLVAGKTISYKLPKAGSGNASLNLTLATGGKTGAKAVYLNTTRVTTHFGEGSVINMTYDGSSWRATAIQNTNNYDRRQHNNYVKAQDNHDLAAYSVCVGTSSGYQTAAAGATFDLDYPVLYLNAANADGQNYAIAGGGQTANMYEAMPSVNLENTVSGITSTLSVNSTVYLKGTVSGNTFTISTAPFFTCTAPISEDGYAYMPIGIVANDATTKLFFATSRDLYAYKDGAFGPVSIREAAAASKTATNYISADSSGIRIANATPATATTYQHLTATDTEFVVGGESVAEFGGSGVRIGKSGESHALVDYHSLSLVDKGGTEYFRVADTRDAQDKATVQDTFVGDGSTKSFTLSNTADSTSYTVAVSDSSGGSVTKTTTKVTFSSAPSTDATITVTYVAEVGDEYKSFTFGSRASGTVVGSRSFAAGGGVEASGRLSHAEGGSTVASGDHSHVEGYNSKAYAPRAHAEGNGTQVLLSGGPYPYYAGHAEGDTTRAKGTGAHAEGVASDAMASAAHAEGQSTQAKGWTSHAQNYGTIANSNHQTALGKYNVADSSDTYAVIVGNGTGNNARSNALAVTWAGDVHDGDGHDVLRGEVLFSGAYSTTYNAPVELDGDLTDVRRLLVEYEDSAGRRGSAWLDLALASTGDTALIGLQTFAANATNGLIVRSKTCELAWSVTAGSWVIDVAELGSTGTYQYGKATIGTNGSIAWSHAQEIGITRVIGFY